MLRIQNLHAGYIDQEILHGINFEVKPAEIVAVIGPNGSGKSTLLKCIFNLAKVNSGKIFFKDRDITGIPTHELVSDGISFVSQGRQVFGNLTVLENLEMGAFVLNDAELMSRNLMDVYSKFSLLKKKKNDYAFNLSGGQQQMLVIARALIQNPQLLLLDEPSLGLSPKGMKDIFEKIKEIKNEGVAVILVEQNAKQACALADKTYVLEDGRIALIGGRELLGDPRIKKIYFGGR